MQLVQLNSLPSLVQGEIEQMILRGELAVSQRVNESELATRFGISRGPVREALRALEESGLVRSEKNRGVFVREISIADADEIYDLREALDELIGRRLALQVTESQLQVLKALVAEMDDATKAKDVKRAPRTEPGVSRCAGGLRRQLALVGHLSPADQGAAAVQAARAAGGRRLRGLERRTQGDGGSHRLARPGPRRPRDARPRGQQPGPHAQGHRRARRRNGPALPGKAPIEFCDPRNIMKPKITVNGRQYQWMSNPLVVVCVDGCESDYIAAAVADGVAPFLAQLLGGRGTSYVADCVIPSFTNPNNLSIVTGAPPSVHGICGNYFFDSRRRRGSDDERPEVPARADASSRRSPTPAPRSPWSPPRTSCASCSATSMKGICFSAEKADEATVDENGIDDVVELVGMPVPSVYSAELSEFVFAAGVKLMERERPDLMYLSTTDYVQHKARAGHAAAPTRSTRMMDSYLAKLDALGATIVLTADHGMNAKTDAIGQPERHLPAGRARRMARRRRGARHPADHRSLRRAPRRARLVRDRLRAAGHATRRLCASASRHCRASSRAVARSEAGARFELPRRPHRRPRRRLRAHDRASAPARSATTCRDSTCRCARTAASRSSACR